MVTNGHFCALEKFSKRSFLSFRKFSKLLISWNKRVKNGHFLSLRTAQKRSLPKRSKTMISILKTVKNDLTSQKT